ncbi:MAG TPA: hypothetical protein EYP62_00370 [Kiritimatiellae bacterium]|nr:hypothetical protein [Kiritimatiellia bacterium]
MRASGRQVFTLGMGVTALLFLGCQAAARDRSDVVTLQDLLARMKDPRSFFLQVLPDESGGVVVGGNRLHPNEIARLRFISSKRTRAPVVAVSGIKTKPVTALIDPASTWSWMTLPTALELQATPLSGIPFQSPGHVFDPAISGVVCRVSTLLMDALSVESALVLATTTPSLGSLERGCRPAPDMVIGAILLARLRSLVFDFRGMKFMAASTFPYRPDPAKLVGSGAFRWAGNLPLVEARVNGIPRELVFDPAGDYELLLPELREPATVRQLTIGDLVLRSVEAIPRPDPPPGASSYGRLGRRCFDDLRVIVVNPPGRIYFEHP